MHKPNLLSVLSFCGSLLALGAIALGAYTRLKDAGLGCPDWPGCYGHLLVPQQVPGQIIVSAKAWAEMIHRYVVGGLSLMILSIIAVIMSSARFRHKSNGCLALALVSVLIYQVILGQWTVTLKLMPVIVTQHLLGGFLILSFLWLLYLNNQAQRPSIPPLPRASWLIIGAVIALLLLLIQILLGAWTSTHYASLSCQDFPFCMNGQSIAYGWQKAFSLNFTQGINYEGGTLALALRQTIQMTHRMGALFITIYLFIYLGLASYLLRNHIALLKNIYTIMALLCIQLSLGMANIIFKLPLINAMAHTIVAALLLLSLLTLFFNLILRSNHRVLK